MLDDIHKRVDSFTAQWKNGKLSDPVKAAMSNLVDGMINISFKLLAVILYCLYICSISKR